MALSTRFRHGALMIAVVSLLQGPARGAGWSDDFNDMNTTDGNPVSWAFDGTNLPGIYSAATGDYVLSARSVDGQGFGNNDSLIAYVPTSFTTTYARTQTVIQPGEAPEEIGGNVGLAIRWDPATLSGYVGILDDGDQFELLLVQFGAPITLGSERGIGLDARNDVIVELSAVGDQISLYGWYPGQAKPETPLFTAIDSTYTSGFAGVIYNEDDDNTAGVFRYAAAQDTPFIDDVGVLGDYDGDDDVDGADFLVWQKDFGSTTNLDADGNNNNSIDAGDLDVWKANFPGGVPVANVAAVPEPVGLTLLGLAALAMAVRGRSTRATA